jgi:hypothetical protein
MQLFLAVTSVPMLFVAILIQERREVENSLRESKARLKQYWERSQLLAHKLISSQEHGELHVTFTITSAKVLHYCLLLWTKPV